MEGKVGKGGLMCCNFNIYMHIDDKFHLLKLHQALSIWGLRHQTPHQMRPMPISVPQIPLKIPPYRLKILDSPLTELRMAERSKTSTALKIGARLWADSRQGRNLILLQAAVPAHPTI